MRTGQLMRRCQQPRSASRTTPATLVAATPSGQNQPDSLSFLTPRSDFPCFPTSAITTPALFSQIRTIRTT